MLSQPAWRRTAPDSSPSHPAGTRPREETPSPRPPCPVNTVCFLLSLSWTFCAPAPRAATSAVLGATESSLPGATPGLAPWLSLASHRALAAPLAASLSLSLLSGPWKCPGATLHLEAAPGPARFQLHPWQSEQGWGSSSSPAGQLDTQRGCPRGQGGTGGWQPPSSCPGVGLCPQGPQGCPTAPWPCWTRPPSLTPHTTTPWGL